MKYEIKENCINFPTTKHQGVLCCCTNCDGIVYYCIIKLNCNDNADDDDLVVCLNVFFGWNEILMNKG